jgi:hypothetical protein
MNNRSSYAEVKKKFLMKKGFTMTLTKSLQSRFPTCSRLLHEPLIFSKVPNQSKNES